MPDAARWLLDTNILLRMSKGDDPHYSMISEALRALVAQGARFCFTSQILGEFWNASTRPRDRNGFGLSPYETDRMARVIERDFELLPDSRDVHDRWRQLLVAHDIKDNKSGAKLWSTTDRRKALTDAKYVFCVVRIGGLEAFQTDVDIPLKYGVDQCVGDTLCAGGINTFEIALGTPNALELIREVRTTFADRVVVGAGTVLDTETARLAVTAGAQFIVAPSLNLDLIRFAKRYSIVVVPGALTPTEILTAWEAGADMVKVFPVRALGPGYIKDVLAPLPQVRLVPVGGVTVEDIVAASTTRSSHVRTTTGR